MVEENINDTGFASDSIRHEIVESNGTIKATVYAVDYLEILNTGRGAGTPPPVDKIFNWVKSKLGITEENEAKKVAFAIRQKIANKGTNIFLDNSKGIEIEGKVSDLINSLNLSLPENATRDFRFEFDKFLKEAIKQNRIK